MHVCDNTFCPLHQRNDNRTYGRTNLEISPNLRVYNFKLKDQEVNLIMTQKSGVFIIIFIYSQGLFQSKCCLIYSMLSLLYLKCTKIISIQWQLPLSYISLVKSLIVDDVEHDFFNFCKYLILVFFMLFLLFQVQVIYFFLFRCF